MLNPEFDAREARHRRSSDGIENGESLITSVAVILASAGVAVLGVMIGLRIFAAPAGSGDAAGGSSSSLAKEMPAGASPFEVNVVDAKNRRWVLGSASAAESTGANLARGAQPLRDAGDPGESAGDLAGNSAGSDRPNIATTLPPLPIKAPHSAQPSRAASEMMAPSIEGSGERRFCAALARDRRRGSRSRAAAGAAPATTGGGGTRRSGGSERQSPVGESAGSGQSGAR